MSGGNNSFWLKVHFNNIFDKQISKRRMKKNINSNKYEKDTKKEEATALTSLITNSDYHKVIEVMYELFGYQNSKILIDDFINFDFENTSSVSNYVVSSSTHPTAKFETQHPAYNITAKTNLLAHTFNVAQEAINKNYELSDLKIILLLCLIHDTGKSKSLMQSYGLHDETMHHEEMSAYYLKELYADTDMQNFSDVLSQCLLEKSLDNMYYMALRECDTLAREREQRA